MPFVNVKLVKGQASPDQKRAVIEGITDLVVSVMGREKNLTVITLDELEPDHWAVGGKTLDQMGVKRVVSFVNIKISKGTSNPAEMAAMMKATKNLMINILGASDETNYFVINELNPDAWGFDAVPMTVRNQTAP